MKHYPSIPKEINTNLPIFAFDKLKTRAWLERLKEHCKGDEKLFELLS